MNNPNIIHGLLSISDKNDHLFMNLIENAHFNKGRGKVYNGVAGNLVAFACKCSLESGYDGFLAFDAKTVLIKHYEETLKAKHFGGRRMIIYPPAALQLVNHYFNK